MADVPDENNASDSPPSSPELQLIQAWLATHLPALPPSDLQSYSSQLLKDGFATPAQLNEINTGKSGRMEDLYFMKKGHRRVLLKKLGLVRTMRGQADNRIGREGGDIPGERGGAPLKGAAVSKQTKDEKLDTSIEEWLAEQNRMVEERRLARLAEEERLSSGGGSGEGGAAGDSKDRRKVKAKRVDRLRDKFGAPSPEDGAVAEDSPEEDEDDYDLDEEDVSLRSKVDVASPFERFRQKTQQTSSSEERSLERLRRDFAERASAEEVPSEDEEELVDDLTARYQSLDAGRRGGEDAARDKQERRLGELRSAFRQRHNTNAPQDLTDDVTARHPSLDKASAEERSRELRRLEELRRASLNRAAAARALSEEDPPDDLSARYDALDKDALEDGSTMDKSARRMEALRREFVRRKAAAAARTPDAAAPLDDLSARYRSLDKDALEDGAARDKPSRRLEAIKREFARRKAAAANNSEAQEEPLDDLTARYRSMGKDRLEDGSARDKGSRRLEEMKGEFARRKAAAARNIEAREDPLDDVTARYQSMSKDLLEKGKPPVDGKERKRVEEFQRLATLAAAKKGDRQRQMQEEVRGEIGQRAAGEDGTPVRKSNEERRLEDIERHFHRRRAARIAEEERPEQMIIEAKMAALEEEDGESVDDARASPSVKDLWEAGGNMALDDGFFEERPATRSLSTTLPPTNKGGGKKVAPSASAKDGPLSDVDLDEYVDITKNNIRERETLSLSTTMPPTNRAVNATRAKQSGGSEEEECIDEDCWDITRSSFPERSQSLSTTLPPKNRPANSALPARTKTELSASAEGSGDDAAFEITQNLFPEGQPPDASAFEEGEKSEMNSRPPNASSPKRSESAAKSEAPTTDATTSDESDQSEMNNRASELYQRFRSERRSSFSEDERSDMNSRPPPRPAASGRSAPDWTRTPGDADDGSVLDILSQFPKDRPSASVNTGAKKGRFTTSGTYEESKRSAPTDDDSSTDIRMNFSKKRPSTLVNTGTEREPEAEPKSGEIPEQSASPAREVDDSYMDIMSSFPAERPSMLVNTGTKKDRVTTSGSYGESKEQASKAAQGDDSYMDIMSNFPKERPAALVNTHTARRETPTYDDESYRNIAQNFSTDTASLRDHPKAREIGSSSQSSGSTSSNDESYRNIAHNFSTDGKSLRGHPQRKDIGSSSQSSEFLDVHRFSGKLSRGSQAKAAATTATWRDPTAVKSGEKFLDTPPAFADSLDMMLSSAPGAVKKRSSPAGNTFPSTSVRSSSTLNRDLKKASATASQPFLDKPRVFQSGVDMKSSNYSGKRFKRSSDIPPEEKNVKDEFEVATEPLPDIGRRPNGRRQTEDEMSDFGRMRMTKERKSVGPSTEEPFTDITRSPWMARLERATSAVKDANKASKGRSGSAAPASGSSGNVAAKSNDNEDEESSFEQVMWWLLGHLPKLQEEDAISYFQSMLEDGFDSLESLEGLTEDDLQFMKSGHRRALLRSVRSEDSEDADAKEDVATDVKETTAAEKPDATIDKAREELEKTEAWIAEQNRLVEERLAARLAEDKASTTKKDEGAPTQRDSTGDFVGRASMSAVAPDSMLTRDPYPDRPSLSSLSQKKSKGAEEDEAFDITREAFGEDRPSSILSASSEPESTDDALGST